MTGLIPFNRRGANFPIAGFDDFYNMLDDFFSDSWPSRNLLNDTFKIDVKEVGNEYLVEAELPGVLKEEIGIDVENENLRISVNHGESINQDGKNYIHRERRSSSMSRNIHLGDVKLDAIRAKLENGILTITIPKQEKTDNSRRIEIE